MGGRNTVENIGSEIPQILEGGPILYDLGSESFTSGAEQLVASSCLMPDPVKLRGSTPPPPSFITGEVVVSVFLPSRGVAAVEDPFQAEMAAARATGMRQSPLVWRYCMAMVTFDSSRLMTSFSNSRVP